MDWDRLGGVVAGIYASREGRPSYVDNGEGAVAGAVVQPVGPADGGGVGGSALVPALCGVGVQDDTPDHATISRFRTELARRGLSERLFGELAAQLEERGLLVKAGTLLDATLVEAQVRRPSTDAGLGAKSERDPMRTGRGVESPRRVRWRTGDELAVYGDRAYESKKRRAWLKSQGIDDCILHRSHKNQSGLPEWQAAAQRGDRAGAGQLRLPAGALLRTGTQRSRDVVEADGLQPEEGGGTDGLKAAGTRSPRQHRAWIRPP